MKTSPHISQAYGKKKLEIWFIFSLYIVYKSFASQINEGTKKKRKKKFCWGWLMVGGFKSV